MNESNNKVWIRVSILEIGYNCSTAHYYFDDLEEANKFAILELSKLDSRSIRLSKINLYSNSASSKKPRNYAPGALKE